MIKNVVWMTQENPKIIKSGFTSMFHVSEIFGDNDVEGVFKTCDLWLFLNFL
jgi:hypothetical protein